MHEISIGRGGRGGASREALIAPAYDNTIFDLMGVV